jgi:hypothetical protein
MKDRRTFAVKRDAAFWSPLWLNAPFHPTELAEKTAPPLPVSKYTMSARKRVALLSLPRVHIAVDGGQGFRDNVNADSSGT